MSRSGQALSALLVLLAGVALLTALQAPPAPPGPAAQSPAALRSDAGPPDRSQVLDAMKRATAFMVDRVAVSGDYVWTYLPDMSRRWGEIEARPTMIWMQPPGTPSMGHAFIALQQPPPQAGWALQYSPDLKPAGARSYEPAALATHTTASNIEQLLRFFRLTGDTAFLAPVPAALEWLEAVRLPPSARAARAIAALDAQGRWIVPLGSTSHPCRGDGAKEIAAGDFSRTQVGDESDTSPFRADPGLTGISTAAYIRNMGALIRLLDDRR